MSRGPRCRSPRFHGEWRGSDASTEGSDVLASAPETGQPDALGWFSGGPHPRGCRLSRAQPSVDRPEKARAMRSFHLSIASWYRPAGSSAVQDLHTMTAAAQRPRRSAGPPHSGHSSCGSVSVVLSELMARPPLAPPWYPRPARFEAAGKRVHLRVALRQNADLRMGRSTNGTASTRWRDDWRARFHDGPSRSGSRPLCHGIVATRRTGGIWKYPAGAAD